MSNERNNNTDQKLYFEEPTEDLFDCACAIMAVLCVLAIGLLLMGVAW